MPSAEKAVGDKSSTRLSRCRTHQRIVLFCVVVVAVVVAETTRRCRCWSNRMRLGGREEDERRATCLGGSICNNLPNRQLASRRHVQVSRASCQTARAIGRVDGLEGQTCAEVQITPPTICFLIFFCAGDSCGGFAESRDARCRLSVGKTRPSLEVGGCSQRQRSGVS